MHELRVLIEDINQLFREVKYELECLRALYAVIKEIMEGNTEDSDESTEQ